MSEKKLISTGSPFEETIGFSRAVAQGPWCFVSGVTGYDYRTMEMPEDVGEQTRNCFNSIQAALTEAGFFMSDIVRVQYTITDATLLDQNYPSYRRDSWRYPTCRHDGRCRFDQTRNESRS